MLTLNIPINVNVGAITQVNTQVGLNVAALSGGQQSVVQGALNLGQQTQSN